MRILIRAIPLALAASLLVLLALACKSGGDDTSREITDEELSQMVLALEDYGGAYAGFESSSDGVVASNQLIEDDSDPEDEADDLQEFGYASGYEAEFHDDAGSEHRAGVSTVSSRVFLFEDLNGAAGYYADSLAEVDRYPEESGEGYDRVEVEYFNVETGDEAKGILISGHIVPEEGEPIPTWISAAMFRHGRIIGVLSMWTYEEQSSEDAINGWARLMDQRMSDVLAGAAASDSPGGDGGSDDLVSADPAAALDASVQSFAEEVNSLQAELAFSMTAGGFGIEASAQMAYQAPDQMHATMDLTGLGRFEMLLRGGKLYMYMPGQGWVVFSLEDAGLDEFGLNAATLQELMNDHSMVDYDGLIESLGGDVTDLGEDTLDDGTFERYRATLDFGDMAAAFSDAFGATSDLGLDSISGPLTLDVWVDPDTKLPHRITASGEFAFGADSMAFDATMRFFGYNQPASIPEAPADAVPFAMLGAP